jgi:hypothetical protein
MYLLGYKYRLVCDHRGRQIEFLSTCPRTGGYQETGCPTSKFGRPTFSPQKGNSKKKKSPQSILYKPNTMVIRSL